MKQGSRAVAPRSGNSDSSSEIEDSKESFRGSVFGGDSRCRIVAAALRWGTLVVFSQMRPKLDISSSATKTSNIPPE